MPHPVYGKVGLLLNGGGAKGIIQAGELQAFVDHGIEYDAIYGSSVGSLNGAMLHQNDLEGLRKLWMTIKSKDVYSWSPLNLVDLFTPKGAIYDNTPLKKLLTRVIDVDYLYRSDKSFHISTTNFSTWAPLILPITELGVDEVVPLLWASATPPYYFPLVKFRNYLLADAGVTTNYNIAKAVKDGCDTLVVMGFALAEPRVPENIKDVISETITISMHGYFERELGMVEKINSMIDKAPELHYRKIKVVKIIPDKPTGIGLLDFDYKQDRTKLWDYGYALAAKALKEQLPNVH